MRIDTSTINQKQLRKYPIYKKPPTYEISRHMGACCAGDAPGYPSYFLQSVYTSHGNTPRNGPDYVIRDDEGNYRRIPEFTWNRDGSSNRDAILDALYLPLPIEHPRVKTWIAHTYQQAAHCYGDPARADKQRHLDGCVIWPMGKWQLPTRPKPTLKVGYGSSATVVKIEAADYRRMLSAYRAEVKTRLAYAWSVAKDPDNHLAVLAIRKFYPDYTPDLDLIANPPKLVQADWWQRYTSIPSESVVMFCVLL